ncbi:unnamed protein product [Amoebophrya sp. A120]|nr:unnamed protein product [Amoebophrya sp. A120]|eukprot:GSA120T00011621001.1
MSSWLAFCSRRAPTRWRIFSAFSVALTLQLASALFLDEIGRWDWARHNIGGPFKFLHTKKAVLTVSRPNVIALVSWSTGKLGWRKVLENRTILDATLDDDKAKAFILATEPTAAAEGVLTVSCFEATASGELVWEKRISSDGATGKLAVVDGNQVVVAHSAQSGASALSALSASKGEPLWTETVAALSGKFEITETLSVIDTKGLLIRSTAQSPEKKPSFREVNVGSAKESVVRLADYSLLLDSSSVSAYSSITGEAVALSGDQKTLAGKALVPLPDTNCFIASTKAADKNRQSSLACLTGENKVVTLHTAKGSTLVPVQRAPSSETDERKTMIAEQSPDNRGLLAIQSWDVLAQKKTDSYGVAIALDAPPSYLAEKSGKLLVYAEQGHQLRVVEKDGKDVWTREEGLGSLVDARFWNVGIGSDALISTANKKSSSPKQATTAPKFSPEAIAEILTQKLTAFAQTLENISQVIIGILVPPLAMKQAKEAAAAQPQLPKLKFDPTIVMGATVTVPKSAETLRTYDGNQLIFGLSAEARKVYAIDAPTGALVWSRYLTADESTAPASTGRLAMLPSADPDSTEKLVAELGGVLFLLAPRTGKVTKKVQLPGVPEKLTQITDTGVMYTSTAATKAVFTQLDTKAAEPQALPTGLYGYDMVENKMSGYALQSDSLEKQETWNLDFGDLSETVLGHQESLLKSNQHVVPVHVRGDASVMFRFLDPNMVTVVTEKNDGSGLTLYLLNAVSGQILHQGRIPSGTGPINFLTAENWALLHYWSQANSRYEIYVVDLYENQEDQGAWKLLFGAEPPPRSAFHLDTPVAIHQTFIFPHRVQGLGITTTAKGITQKAVLFSLANSEQVVKLNKDQWLNPRRPLKLPDGTEDKARTQSLPKNLQVTKDDVMIPYMPLLVVQPTDVLSYYVPVRTTKFASSPTSLESTSFSFAYGLDLFFAPVRPSNAYDILGEAFDFTVLYTSGGITFVAWVVTQRLVRYKTLKDRWK